MRGFLLDKMWGGPGEPPPWHDYPWEPWQPGVHRQRYTVDQVKAWFVAGRIDQADLERGIENALKWEREYE